VRNKILTVLMGLTLALTLIFGLLPACGGGGGTTAPTSGGGGGAAPVAQGQVYNWRYQNTGNAGTSTYWTFQELVATIKQASGGRLVIQDQPQGAIVGVMEIFDAVATGAIECGSACD